MQRPFAPIMFSCKGGPIMLNENIKALRKAKGLSQVELAVKLNVVRQTVSKWESDEVIPELSKIIELSDIFACD